MTDPKGSPNFMRKRFYTEAGVERAAGGFALKLDGRTVRTPAKGELVLPSEALALAVAAEWQAQEVFINPATMPLTRLANTTIDGVAVRFDDVRDDAANYAGSDLVCYRADGPGVLVERQALGWDPVIRAMEAKLGTRFAVTSGIMPAEQPADVAIRVSDWFVRRDAFEVAALHVMTTISGSCILAMAHAEGIVDIETLWRLAHIDEDYQMEFWGRDEEAMRMRAHRWQEIEAAARFMQLVRQT